MSGLKRHMMIHLPPTFACSKCDRKFVQGFTLKSHLKIHAGILNEECKICNKGFSSKTSFSQHIIQQHFTKLHCEIAGCSHEVGSKAGFKNHFKKVHKKVDENFLQNLMEKLGKLKPDFQKLKYV